MQTPEKIVNTYDTTAEHYASTRIDELSKKHLDRLLLNAFATENVAKGVVADFGCGPGHTTKFLVDCGIKEIIGIDISPGMVNEAQKHFPGIRFMVGDLLALPFASNYFSSAIAFYAIVNLEYDMIDKAFAEVNRVLKNGGQFLFSFHVGEGKVHFDKVNEREVDIDMYLWPTKQLLDLLIAHKFKIVDAIERLPYTDIEYPSKRGYVLAAKSDPWV